MRFVEKLYGDVVNFFLIHRVKVSFLFGSDAVERRMGERGERLIRQEGKGSERWERMK